MNLLPTYHYLWLGGLLVGSCPCGQMHLKMLLDPYLNMAWRSTSPVNYISALSLNLVLEQTDIHRQPSTPLTPFFWALLL